MNTKLEALQNNGTPEQRKRFKRINIIFNAVKDLGFGSLRAGIIQQYAKSWGLSTITVNKYVRYGKQMEEEAQAQKIELGNDGSMGTIGKVVVEEVLDTDFEFEPPTPPEGLKTAQEYVKAIGGLTVDNFGYADPTWPWEGASVQIEQMTNNEVVIHMTVTISQEQMIETVLGLMTKSNIGFSSKLIG